MQRKQYSIEFKKQAVKEVEEIGNANVYPYLLISLILKLGENERMSEKILFYRGRMHPCIYLG